MKLLLRLAARLVGIVIAFSVSTAAIGAVAEHFGHKGGQFTEATAQFIDKGLSLLPDSAEASAKNMLTALEDAVSGITKKAVSRLIP